MARGLAALLLVAALANAAALHADPAPELALSQNAEGRWLAAFLDVFNTGDGRAIARFAGSTGNDPAYLYSLYREFGPLAEARHEPGAYWLRGEVTGAWVGIELAPAGEGFEICGVRRGLRPENAPMPEPLGPEALQEYLDAYLSASTAGGHFSGAVLVARGGEVLFSKAYGFADREAGTPNTLDTRFNLASVTKTFIGVAIAQLAEAGKLSFDDPLARFVPEYPLHIAEQVTVHHLLTHTSGIELDDHEEYNDAVAGAGSLDDLLATQVRFIEHLNRGNYEDFEPLGRFDYTNEGIDLLGVVIERASGQEWHDYLSDHVFGPAGMSRTGLLDARTEVPGLASGYSLRVESLSGFVSGARREVDTKAMSHAARPAGSAYSTVGDMLRFATGLEDGRLLDRAHWELVTSPHVETITIGDLKRAYGYAFEIDRQGDLLTVGHGGGAPGMSTQLEIYPERGYVVVVLSNFDRSAARNVSSHIKELIGF